ncbi:hypothetical protein [Streptomyces sp. AK02-01A]|uniref:hypothetical protein n=1 Tax=Streptomyces sp. AK02-01A TaxID=3028648 RepID=UPI0029BF62C1|nr:hypothetical protein [Streptomyces sp. AK02-01A]MDX3853421.1 hypothetical protein [Streptomyces sp. AK02-01A]
MRRHLSLFATGAAKAGFAAPSAAGQRDAVLGALRAAGVPADSVLHAHHQDSPSAKEQI